MDPLTFHSPGKLLITGEYAVLDGALALAIPTRYGQSMGVKTTKSNTLAWQSLDATGNTWFQEVFQIDDLSYLAERNPISETLQHILRTAKQMRPSFLSETQGYEVTTKLDFPRNWGLGTSSTLIHNISEWAQVDAHALLQQSFGGSGYDIAVAAHKKPILFRLHNHLPEVTPISLPWNFTQHLFFVHLNEKKDSKEGIKQYRKVGEKKPLPFQPFSDLTQEIAHCSSLERFSELLAQHEAMVSSLIETSTIKSQHFPDYDGAIKSLGAWGGDFILAVMQDPHHASYFREKGYKTIIPFEEMIL